MTHTQNIHIARRKAQNTLRECEREMKRAADELRSGDEHAAREAVIRLGGYLQALDDLEIANDQAGKRGSKKL